MAERGGAGVNVPPILYVISFGYRYDNPPVANLVLDVRWLPNPFYQPEFHDLSGRDEPIQAWLFRTPTAQAWFEAVLGVLGPTVAQAHDHDSRAVTVAFGCQGGHDRSPAVAERFAKTMRRADQTVFVEHRDIHHRGRG